MDLQSDNTQNNNTSPKTGGNISPRVDHPDVDTGKILVKRIDKVISMILLLGLFYLICRIKYINFGIYDYQSSCVSNVSECKNNNCTQLLFSTINDATELLTIHWIFLVCLMMKGLYLTSFKIQEVNKAYGPYCMLFNALMIFVIITIAFVADDIKNYLPGMFIGAVFINLCLYMFYCKINNNFYNKNGDLEEGENLVFDKIKFITMISLNIVIMIIATTLTYIVYWTISNPSTVSNLKIRQGVLYTSLNFFICLISVMFHIFKFLVNKPNMKNNTKDKTKMLSFVFEMITSTIIYAVTMIFHNVTYYIGISFLFTKFFIDLIEFNIPLNQNDNNNNDDDVNI